MGLELKKFTADSFREGEETLKAQLNNKYEIVDVSVKRKWFVGPKYCDITYIDLTEMNNKTIMPSAAPIVPEKMVKASPVKTEDVVSKEDLNELSNEMGEMKDMFESLMKEVGVALQKAEKNSNDALVQVEEALIKNGVTKEIAQEIIKRTVEIMPKRQKTVSKNTILFALKDVLEKSLNTCEGFDFESVKTLMLIGTTGVGKTTTLAKLAGMLFAKNRQVGMITLDKYRLGAAEQSMAYGNIMGYPVEACKSIDELELSLLKFMDKNNILIDTTGQSQKNVEIDDELREMVDLVNPDQLSLVLSATTKTEDLFDCIEKFSILDFNSIIITKIDETNSLGGIINIAYKYPNKKIAYFTTGQTVPSDIEGARPEKVIKSVIGA